MNPNLQSAIQAATLRGITEWGYYGTALCSLNFYESSTIATLLSLIHI